MATLGCRLFYLFNLPISFLINIIFYIPPGVQLLVVKRETWAGTLNLWMTFEAGHKAQLVLD